MLTPEQCAEFEDLGFVRVPGVFSPEAASRMRDVLWRELAERYGMVRDDPATWTTLRPYTFKSTKSHMAFSAMAGPALIEAIEQLLGPGSWRVPKHWGQVMVTMPSPGDRWQLPRSLWHCDYGFDLPTSPLPALKMFAFFGPVERHGGGTLVIARSHRLAARFISALDRRELDDYKGLRDQFVGHHPWLRGLRSGREDVDRVEFYMERDGDVDGIAARVVELTGQPGDIVLTHPWLFHCVAPNTSSQPRMMRTVGWRRRPPEERRI